MQEEGKIQTNYDANNYQTNVMVPLAKLDFP